MGRTRANSTRLWPRCEVCPRRRTISLILSSFRGRPGRQGSPGPAVDDRRSVLDLTYCRALVPAYCRSGHPSWKRVAVDSVDCGHSASEPRFVVRSGIRSGTGPLQWRGRDSPGGSSVPEWRNGRRGGLKHRWELAPVWVRVPPPAPPSERGSGTLRVPGHLLDSRGAAERGRADSGQVPGRGVAGILASRPVSSPSAVPAPPLPRVPLRP